MDRRDALPERLLRGPSRAAVDGHRNTAEPSGELSVGDVVLIGGKWFAVAGGGFTRLETEPTAFSVALWPGSNPIDEG
jgi:hypothetical protein